MKKIASAGSALVDIVAFVDDALLMRLGLPKGGRVEFARDKITSILAELGVNATKACKEPAAKPCASKLEPGGSTANALIGAANLGAPTAFLGMCGNDELGQIFSQDLAANGVENCLVYTNAAPTGICLSLVTADSERTMLVDLAASGLLTQGDVPASFFNNAGIAHFEGYMALGDTGEELTLSTMQKAKSQKALIALDMGSFTVVNAKLAFFKEVMANFVDIAIVNLEEGQAFAQSNNENDILDSLSAHAKIVALKKGAAGSVIRSKGKDYVISPAADINCTVVDSTGAGDLWAGGLFYGLVNGLDMATTGNIASACGFYACCNVGAAIKPHHWQSVLHNFALDN